LLHFLLIGTAAFVANSLIQAQEDAAIVINASLKQHLHAEFEAARGRAPSGQELGQELARYKRQQVVVRAAQERGLGERDAVVRSRLATLYRETQAELVVPSDPTEAEAHEWFAANRLQYAIPNRYDLRHVFASNTEPEAEQRVKTWLTELEGGVDAATLGDVFPRGRALVGVNDAQLRDWFGEPFARAIPGQPVQTWRVLASRAGWHVVRIEFIQGGVPDFDEVRARVISDMRAEQQRASVEESIDTLVREARFVEEP
jgi:hypothetical protein